MYDPVYLVLWSDATGMAYPVETAQVESWEAEGYEAAGFEMVCQETYEESVQWIDEHPEQYNQR